MTTFFSSECKCCVCEATAHYNCLGSTNTFGGCPDLDTRPPEMARSTIGLWVHECPECGYAAPDVEDVYEFDHALLESDRYKNCDGIVFKSKSTERFYRRYMITESVHDYSNAFQAALWAAWMCDDTDDKENAVLCRKKAVAQLNMFLESKKDIETEQYNTLRVMKADLMRRAGMFDEVISEYSDKTLNDKLLDSIIAFTLEKAKEHDAECYTVDDVSDETE